MRGIFDEEEPAPPQQRRDTELTLGSGTLLAIFFGLVLICGVCFGLGYAVGHRGTQESTGVVQQAGAAPVPAQADGSKAKPSASAASAAKPASRDIADLSVSAETNSSSGSSGPGSAAGAGSAQVSPAQVRPALPGAVAASQGSVPVAAGALMVQIAAVSSPEDADVLMGALRRRGYAVAARRDADGMIHVRIGPFSSRDEAEKWKLKLLNDGYNAILQP